MTLASFPSPSRGVLELGPLPLRAYALCIILAIVVGVWWGNKRWVARGGDDGTVADIAVFAVPFGLVGGRIYHVATDWRQYFGEGANPVDALKIWEGGLGIWGAVALGGVGAWIACRRRGIPLPAMADALGAPIVVGQAIGRIGNYFNQELYGRTTTLPWGMEIFQRVDAQGNNDSIGGVAPDGATAIAVVHPTFLYELLWNLGVAALVVWADRRFRLGHGRAFALYVAGYCAGRFWIELMRDDPATMVLGTRINVFTAGIVFVLAALYLWRAPRGREDPAALGTAAEVDAPVADVGDEVGGDATAEDLDGADAPAGRGAAVDEPPTGRSSRTDRD